MSRAGRELDRGPSIADHEIAEHRRRSRRQDRHEARARLRAAEPEVLDELVLPGTAHDVGRKPSPPPRRPPSHGQEPHRFKVWKTRFWKRRTTLRSQRNAASRRLAED